MPIRKWSFPVDARHGGIIRRLSAATGDPIASVQPLCCPVERDKHSFVNAGPNMAVNAYWTGTVKK
jgi:hypothetical protein